MNQSQASLALAVGNTAFGQVVGRELHRNRVAGDNSNEVLAHFASDMRNYLMAVFKFDTKLGARERLCNRAG